MKRLLAAGFALVLNCGANAAEIPDIDSAELCAKQAANRPDDKYLAMACRAVEGDARAKLSYKWGYIPDKVTEFCLRGTQGYAGLNICLDEALKRLPSGGYTFSEDGRESRYWTHAECMAARNGGHGVCINR